MEFLLKEAAPYCPLVIPDISVIEHYHVQQFERVVHIGGSGGGGGVPGAHHPLWDPILSFSHTFSPKSTRIGGPRLPTGNPGSATGALNNGQQTRNKEI